VKILCLAALLCMTGCWSERVLLNERVFEVPASFELPRRPDPAAIGAASPAPGGCTVFDLGGGGATTGVDGTPWAVITQKLDVDSVVVTVARGTATVAERRYDRGFFESDGLDDFVVEGAGQRLWLRYWGSVDPRGVEGCPPLTANGP
jgi:hypothetical protein